MKCIRHLLHRQNNLNVISCEYHYLGTEIMTCAIDPATFSHKLHEKSSSVSSSFHTLQMWRHYQCDWQTRKVKSSQLKVSNYPFKAITRCASDKSCINHCWNLHVFATFKPLLRQKTCLKSTVTLQMIKGPLLDLKTPSMEEK